MAGRRDSYDTGEAVVTANEWNTSKTLSPCHSAPAGKPMPLPCHTCRLPSALHTNATCTHQGDLHALPGAGVFCGVLELADLGRGEHPATTQGWEMREWGGGGAKTAASLSASREAALPYVQLQLAASASCK